MTNSPIPFSKEARELMPGEYIHYKGGLYIVLSAARHSETHEEVVVYTSRVDGYTWVRPLKSFLGTVVVDGEEQPRFKRTRLRTDV